ncbi:MAG: hypothetical protein LBU22_05200 [Dysgonamonadaceae bacterium]|nr:hypothetical protein [Dysgonamonadaceae bacterium]
MEGYNLKKRYICDVNAEIQSFLPDYFIQINKNCIVNGEKVKSIVAKDRKVKVGGEFFAYSVSGGKVFKYYY